MEKHTVVMFRPYPFHIGQKIHIEEGSRRGDWEVVNVTNSKVTLRCPVSLKEFTWSRFCYFTEERDVTEWPQKD